MTSRGILIHCSGGSGSSLLSHTMRMCGMYYGEDTEGWDNRYYHHLERNDVEEAIRKGDNPQFLSRIFPQYKERAEAHGYDFHGMKFTYFSSPIWERTKYYLDSFWPNAIKVSTVRHPYTTWRRSNKKTPIGIDNPLVTENWLSSFKFREYLYYQEGFQFLLFPEDWMTGRIKEVIQKLGLYWTDRVYEWFERGSVTGMSFKDRLVFQLHHPDVHRKYRSLCRLAIGERRQEMSPRPILILCLGGESNSLLAHALRLCGVTFGDKETYWRDAWIHPHMEHSFVTGLMGHIAMKKPEREEAEALLKLQEVLSSYKRISKNKGWDRWALKTTSGICRNKWPKVKPVFLNEWPNVLFIALLRRPHPEAYSGWNTVWSAREDIAKMGGIYLPFPYVFEEIDVLKEFFVEYLGLKWNPEIESLYDREKHGALGGEIKDEKIRGQYEWIIEQSSENTRKLYWEQHQGEGWR